VNRGSSSAVKHKGRLVPAVMGSQLKQFITEGLPINKRKYHSESLDQVETGEIFKEIN
jgi:hypothetical protein